MKEGLVQRTGLSLNVTSLREILQLRPTETEDLIEVGGQDIVQTKHFILIYIIYLNLLYY